MLNLYSPLVVFLNVSAVDHDTLLYFPFESLFFSFFLSFFLVLSLHLGAYC